MLGSYPETDVKSKFFRLGGGDPRDYWERKGPARHRVPSRRPHGQLRPSFTEPWGAGQDRHQLLHPRVQDAAVLPPGSLCHWQSTPEAINVPPYQAAPRAGEAALRWSVGMCRRIPER